MPLKLVLAIAVLLAVSANRPCFAKDGHAQHGARASAGNNSGSGKGASAANPATSKANVAPDADLNVAPPVLPPNRQQHIQTSNPGVKIVIPANSSRGQAGASTAPTARNAIGQPVVAPRNFAGAPPAVSPLQKPGAVLPLAGHGPPGASGTLGGRAAPPVVSSGTAHVNVANATNRGSINGASVIRPATAPPAIGGPAQPRYGINGTAMQSKR